MKNIRLAIFALLLVLVLVGCQEEVKKVPSERVKIGMAEQVPVGVEVIGESPDLTTLTPAGINEKNYILESGSKNQFIVGRLTWHIEVAEVEGNTVDLFIEDIPYSNIQQGKIIVLNNQTYFRIENIYHNVPNPEKKNMVSFYLMNGDEAIKSTLYEEQIKWFDFRGERHRVESIFIGSATAPLAKFIVNHQTTDAMKAGETHRVSNNLELGVIDVYLTEGGDAIPSDFVKITIFYDATL